jgi:Tol biopolymer transport system component
MPDNRRVVVACSAQPDSSRTHLYLADIRSGEVRPLVVGIGSEGRPDVSRDGQKLVYSALQEDTDIAEIPLDGSAAHDLMASNRLERDPSWSARGRQLAYVTDRNGPDEIWLTTLDQGWDRPLVTPRSFRDGEASPIDSPAFSPDGQRLAFERGAHIWIVSVAGGSPVQIGKFGSMDLAPVWSPDGNWIAFQARDRGLMKVRVGTQGPPILVHADIRRVDCVPEWSPKGDWIAYCTDQGAALISPDGQSVRILRSPGFLAMGWAPNGSILYGLTTQDRQQSIVALDTETRREKLIMQLEPQYRIGDVRTSTLRLSVAPDGKSLAVTVRRVTSDIWMLESFDPKASLLSRLWGRRQ